MRTGRPVAQVLLAATLVALLAACARPRAPEISPGVPPVAAYEETGLASWYGHPYHGRRTASGEVYDMSEMTAAHQTLPFDTWLLVENLASDRSAVVRVNDRGPFVDGRILDLSYGAARVLGAVAPGVIRVRLRSIPPPVSGTEPAGTFGVQVGAFGEAARARALAAELARIGARPSVQAAEVGGRTFHRVRIGGFPTREIAAREAARLARAGYTVLIVDP